MANPLPAEIFKGGNKSLVFAGKTTPLGPQVALASGLKPLSTLGLPIDGDSIIVNKPNVVIDGFDLRGKAVTVQADGLVLRNCLMNAIGYHTIYNMAGRGLVIEQMMFDGEKANNKHVDFVYTEAPDTIVRTSVFLDCPSDAVNMVGGTLTRSAFRGACYQTGAHADALSVHKTFGKMVVTENYVDFQKQPDSTQGPNSCMKIVSHFGTIRDVTITGNVLIGGGFNSYVGDGGKGRPDLVTLANNLMGLTEYGDKPERFIAGGDHGTSFTMTGNSLFSAAPEGVVQVIATGVQPAPAPAPVPTPAPTPVPAGRTFTAAEIVDLKAALLAAMKIIG
jgi:hypothetical protein